MQRVIRYFQGPAFSEAEWSARNPLLLQGEIGYMMEAGVVKAAKVGPGYWNDLEFIGEDIYTYPEAVTNPIGDATGVLQGNSVAEIINKMLNPYQPPVISSLTNNAGAGFLATTIKEIGQTITGSVLVTFALSNPANLAGPSPINISAGGVFSNEGAHPFTVPIQLFLPAPLSPAGQQVIDISVSASHINGVTPVSHTYIRFYPKIMWLTSAQATMPPGVFEGLSGRQQLITNNYKITYSFSGGGYVWLAIPSMLGPSGLLFTDITIPNAPANFSMDPMGTVSINNGVGTYNYTLYRSTFSLINPTIVQVS